MKAIAPITEDEPPLSREEMEAFAEQQAHEMGVSSAVVKAVISCESGWNPEARGDGGYSRGLVQIHSQYHPDVTDEMADDPRYAITFLVEHLAAGQGNLWTCYRML